MDVELSHGSNVPEENKMYVLSYTHARGEFLLFNGVFRLSVDRSMLL